MRFLERESRSRIAIQNRDLVTRNQTRHLFESCVSRTLTRAYYPPPWVACENLLEGGKMGKITEGHFSDSSRSFCEPRPRLHRACVRERRKAHRITGCRSIQLATATAGDLKHSQQAGLWPISLGRITRQINFRRPSSLFSVATWQPFRHPDLWPRFDAASFYPFGPVLPTEKGRDRPSAVPMENT